MTHVACRLTAKNRDQLRNPTLGNRVWATFIFMFIHLFISFIHLQEEASTSTSDLADATSRRYEGRGADGVIRRRLDFDQLSSSSSSSPSVDQSAAGQQPQPQQLEKPDSATIYRPWEVWLKTLSSSFYLPNNTTFLPSVLWRCWLGGRKGIRPVKNWLVGCWRGYLSGAFRSRPPKYSSPSGSGAKPQPTNALVHIVQLWWQQFLLILLRTNVIFCTETSLISYGVTICIIDCQCSWVQFLTTGRRPMRSCSPGPAAIIALWKYFIVSSLFRFLK